MPPRGDLSGAIDPKRRRVAAEGAAHPDSVIAGLASRQWGVVARSQLVAAGISDQAIRRRLESRHLVAFHRGVYALGGAVVSRRGRWTAAVLAVRGLRGLGYRSATALWASHPYRGPRSRSSSAGPPESAGAPASSSAARPPWLKTTSRPTTASRSPPPPGPSSISQPRWARRLSSGIGASDRPRHGPTDAARRRRARGRGTATARSGRQPSARTSLTLNVGVSMAPIIRIQRSR